MYSNLSVVQIFSVNNGDEDWILSCMEWLVPVSQIVGANDKAGEPKRRGFYPLSRPLFRSLSTKRGVFENLEQAMHGAALSVCEMVTW